MGSPVSHCDGLNRENSIRFSSLILKVGLDIVGSFHADAAFMDKVDAPCSANVN